MKTAWKPLEHIELLENGEAYFPRVFEAIERAQREVLIETFILFEDKVGLALHAVMLRAAQRGVQVTITVDGYGSPNLSEHFLGTLASAGVRFHIFDHQPQWLGVRLNVFRRLHRKLVVVDGEVAFVGGINFSADHLGDFGPEAKQDYAVMVTGAIVEDIHRFTLAEATPPGTRRFWWPRKLPGVGQVRPDGSNPSWAAFVTRDNQHHRTDIERHYRLAIRAAKRELILAHAYFFPGYRFLRDLRNAAKRGVKVTLILQGEPDMPIVKAAARTLYRYLLGAGVEIHEYCERPLHGKVALADDQWATVGSSNLDPLSLSLNLEANLLVWDHRFNRHLRERLQHLIDHHCQCVDETVVGKQGPWRVVLGVLVFHFLRRFPKWADWLPVHNPRLTSVPAPATTRAPVTDLENARLNRDRKQA